MLHRRACCDQSKECDLREIVKVAQLQSEMLNGGSHARLGGCENNKRLARGCPSDEGELWVPASQRTPLPPENVHRPMCELRSGLASAPVRSFGTESLWVRFGGWQYPRGSERLNVINDARAVASSTSRSIHHVPAITARAGAKGPRGATASSV